MTAAIVGALLALAPLAVQAQPTVDGETTESGYVTLGTSPAEPGGSFTGGVTALKAYSGPDTLYIALEGKIRNGQADGTFREMMLFVNAKSVDGIDPGTMLPPGSDGLSPFCCVDSTRMDMETDFGIRLSGGDSPQAFASFADYAGYVAGDSTGSGQVMDTFEGTVVPDGPSVVGGATGGVYAYDDTSDISMVDGTGWEMGIPHDSLGTSESDKFQFFAVYGDVEGDTISATLVPDDEETTLYRNDENWRAVEGKQATGLQRVDIPLITVDGNTTEDRYFDLGTSPPEPGGSFTGGVTGLRAYNGPDSLYIAVEGKVRNGQGDGTFREMMLFINSDGVDGVDAGTMLPPGSDGLSPFCCVDSTRMDMETDFGIRLSGGDDPQAFASFADYAGYVAGDSTGSGQVMDSFEATLSPLDGTSVTGGATGGNYAYDDTSDISMVDGTGWEMAIPHSALGTSPSDEFQFFAVYGDVEGDTLSATLIPDDGETTLYRNDEDWTAVSGMQATGADPLPVELATFTARRDGEDAVLNWETASEENNAGFAVQHAVGSSDFQQIGWVEGVGTTTEAQTYRFVAEDLSAGTHRFRLKQEDLDGSSSLTQVVEVNVRPEGPVAIQKVAPNPVTGTSTLRFTARESGTVTVSLYDVLGRRIATLHDGRVSSDQPQQVTLDASSLSSGVYFLRVEGDGFTKTRRLTVVQ